MLIDPEKMRKKALRFDISLSDSQIHSLEVYASMLVDWNTRMNLTGIVDPDGIMTRHFEDSLCLLHYVTLPEHGKLIDVGTGAGFPGMVLKILRPDLSVTLLDSLNKRLLFLQAVSEALFLPVDLLHARAEEEGRDSLYREQFDLACARAVADLRVLSEFCLPYVKLGGSFLSLKGPDLATELDSAKPGIGSLGGKCVGLFSYDLSDGSGRSLAVIQKIRPTPMQFPRSMAKINKKPL